MPIHATLDPETGKVCAAELPDPPAPAGGVPIGGIILWSGTVASIPATWALCDGNNGTPDLRDKFVVGAKQDDDGTAKTNLTGSLTQAGGSVSHHHADHSFTQPGAHSNLTHAGTAVDAHAVHTHSTPSLSHDNNHAGGAVPAAVTGISIGTSQSGSSHNHTVTSPTGNSTTGITVAVGTTAVTPTTHSSGGGHTHDKHTGTTKTLGTATGVPWTAPTTHSTDGAHQHDNHGLTWGPTITEPGAGTGHSHIITSPTGNEATHTHVAGAITEPNSGTGHTHGFTNPTAHSSHGADTTGNPSASLSHSVTQPSDHTISAHSGGAVDTHDTLSVPMPYYALAYIMRLS